MRTRCNGLNMVACLSLCAIVQPALAATWADPSKVLREPLAFDITGLDPAATQDIYSAAVINEIFEGLYDWDYIERPYRFTPRLAAAMPSISADGRTWTIKLRHGVYFTDDPVFAGHRRELTAADFVYAWKRSVDPRVRSPNSNVLSGKIVGLDAAIAAATATGRFDYDKDVPGLRATDRYTLQVQLIEPDYTFLTTLNNNALRAVAREVIERYADASGRAMDHPVGTGPYRLKEWQRGSRVTLEANTAFREQIFPAAPAGADTIVRAAAEAMRSKRLPQIGVIEMPVVEESNPRLLMFSTGQLDLTGIGGDVIPRVMNSAGQLLPEYANKGVQLQRDVELTVVSSYFNMDDPVVGGYTPERIALRRAICSAYNVPDEIRVLRNGQGSVATQPLPPGIAGHIPDYAGLAPYDPAVARALLDNFGYRDRDGSGFRSLPDGKPLVLDMASDTGAESRQYDELWKRSLEAVGIKVVFHVQNFPDRLKAVHAGQFQISTFSWSGDTADDFMQPFYSPNAGAANLGRFHNAQFDAMYLQTRRVASDAERAALYARMTRLVGGYAPTCDEAYRISNTLAAPSVRGYVKNAHDLTPRLEYLDLVPAAH